jgi:hypothetical protein
MNLARKLKWLGFIGAVAATWIFSPALAEEKVILPEGFTISPASISPDRRLGVLVPDTAQYQEKNGNRLVEVSTGRELAVILARTGMEHMNHGGISPRWSADGTGLLWLVGGKWSPRAMAYLRITGGKVEWQRDLLTLSQQEILKRTRAADPVAYAAVVKENKDHAEAYPEGFTIDVNVVGRGAELPLPFVVALTSDPKHVSCPPGMTTNSGRLYDPRPSERKPFDAMPMGEVVEARMRGLLAADGTISWTGFTAATGAKAVKRHQYLTGEVWRGYLPEDLAAKLREAAPEALAAADAHAKKDPEKRAWTLLLRSVPRAPDSLALDLLLLMDSDEGEIVASLDGGIEEDGNIRWGKLVVATGPDAVKRRDAIGKDDSFQPAAEAEIRTRVDVDAPEILAALRTFAATQPGQDEVCAVDFPEPGLRDSQPGIRPRAFSVTLEPAFAPDDVTLPLDAEFLARLEGTTQADGSLAWGPFSILRGEEARRARLALDSDRNHAGWPSF